MASACAHAGGEQSKRTTDMLDMLRADWIACIRTGCRHSSMF